MKKLRLDMDTLVVESFGTTSQQGRRGTVAGREHDGPTCMCSGGEFCLVTCFSCVAPTCDGTCPETCPNTCAVSCGCTAVCNGGDLSAAESCNGCGGGGDSEGVMWCNYTQRVGGGVLG